MRLTTLSMGEALDFVILVAGTEWVPYSDEPLATRYDDHLAASLGSVTARDEYGDVHTLLVRQFAKVLTADDVAARAALVNAQETTLETEAPWTAACSRSIA